MKRLLLAIVILLTLSNLQAKWSASAIYYATEDELRSMSEVRGLEIGTPDSMRRALYEYEGVEAYSIVEESEESTYTLSILSADSLENIDGSIRISGNASISFTSTGQDAKRLEAGQIIVDPENKQITALENVSLHDESKNASINEISADIVSVLWDSGELVVTNATTSSERKNSNDEAITFYTTGNKLTYFPKGGIVYEDGYMSSDPVNRYSSIKADQIAVLNGGDMFISNAYLSIGRVPILYLPFFFFPGSRVLGNPSFGFDSSMGAFVNTTFELLGSFPDAASSDKASSFTAIFKSTGNGSEQVPVGFYYDEGRNLSNIERWARNSESYIALLADAYSGTKTQERLSSGLLHFGLDSKINLLDKKLKISIQDGFGFSNPAHKNISDSIFRYYGINILSFSGYGLKVDGIFPFYSDDYVLKDFKNRIIGFSLDPILGQNPTFPENYTTSISSYTQSLNMSYSLPSKYTSKYISSFSISNLRASGLYKWTGEKDNASNKSFKIDELEKPYLSANISGAIFETKHTMTSTVKETYDEKTPESEIHILSDPLLYPLYKENDLISIGKETSTEYSSSLKYSISETLTNKDSYSYGKLSSSSFSTSTSSKFTLSAGIGSFFSFSDILTPTYYYSENKTYDDKTSVKSTERTAMSNEVSLQVPIIGFKYVLGTKLVNNETKATWDEGVSGSYSESTTSLDLAWDKNTVTQHQISLSKAFSTDIGTFTPSIAYTLKPLTGAFIPKLSYKYGEFASSFSWKFLENDSGDYSPDLAEWSIGYNGRHITFSSAMKYDSSKFKDDDFFYPFSSISSLSLRSADKKWSITEYMDYYAYSEKYSQRDYFNSLKTTFSAPFGSAFFNWKTQSAGNLEFNDFGFNITFSSKAYQFWKGRVYIKFDLNSTFNMDLNNKESSTFTITPAMTFSIAEFLDFKLSFSSYNNNFSTYFDGDEFKLDWMFQDLMRSFDFFGNGRRNTSFLLKNASLEAIHYMKDWDLHCKYSTEIVQSSNIYSLVPKFSIYLSWKTMPDLKVDKKWKQQLTTNGYQWVEE